MSESDETRHYEIRVQGHLDNHWTDWLGGMAIKNVAGGEAVLSGPLPDQAALYGVLIQIRDLGLPLISVRRMRIDPRHDAGLPLIP